jgi:hypothetical protein
MFQILDLMACELTYEYEDPNDSSKFVVTCALNHCDELHKIHQSLHSACVEDSIKLVEAKQFSVTKLALAIDIFEINFSSPVVKKMFRSMMVSWMCNLFPPNNLPQSCHVGLLNEGTSSCRSRASDTESGSTTEPGNYSLYTCEKL